MNLQMLMYKQPFSQSHVTETDHDAMLPDLVEPPFLLNSDSITGVYITMLS